MLGEQHKQWAVWESNIINGLLGKQHYHWAVGKATISRGF